MSLVTQLRQSPPLRFIRIGGSNHYCRYSKHLRFLQKMEAVAKHPILHTALIIVDTLYSYLCKRSTEMLSPLIVRKSVPII